MRLIAMTLVMMALIGVATAQERYPYARGSKTLPPNLECAGATFGSMPTAMPTAPVRLTIIEPREGAILESGTRVEVQCKLEEYNVYRVSDAQPFKGQHIHFILDNDPYKAVYGTETVFENLKPGTHTLRVFPARPWHESIKSSGAFATRTFHVEKKSRGPHLPDLSKPMLTYSRPKGTYKGVMAKRVLLDFWVSNCRIDLNGPRVRYSVNKGPWRYIYRWPPGQLLYLDNLSSGHHALTVELVDHNNRLIENGGYNRTTRVVCVEQ